ncbi:MAG: hypothetical protein AABX34_06790 [Nanoarchaeota archaeon]
MKKSVIMPDGARIYYKINKFNSRNFLIFVHGLSGNHTAFNPVIRMFNKKRVSNSR